jgi:hypothetical protein
MELAPFFMDEQKHVFEARLAVGGRVAVFADVKVKHIGRDRWGNHRSDGDWYEYKAVASAAELAALKQNSNRYDVIIWTKKGNGWAEV